MRFSEIVILTGYRKVREVDGSDSSVLYIDRIIRSPAVIHGVEPADPAFERHYSVAELVELWGLSEKTVRRIFWGEPGVLEWGHDEERFKYRDLFKGHSSEKHLDGEVSRNIWGKQLGCASRRLFALAGLKAADGLFPTAGFGALADESRLQRAVDPLRAETSLRLRSSFWEQFSVWRV